MNPDESKRKAPAFQFYADDFLAGTLDMSQEDVGSYIRLLCHQWSRGSIPVETEKQQRLAGGSISVDVLVKFPVGDDGLRRNPRLEEERAKQMQFRQKQREKGLKSAETRKMVNHGSTAVATTVQPDGQPNTQPDGQPEGNSPSPSPTPNNKSKDDQRSPWSVRFEIEMPESLRTQPCMDAIRLWLDYKTEKREGYKRIGLQAALTKWSKEFTPAEFPSCVENSIASGWKGIFRKSSNQSSLPMQAGSKSVFSTNIADWQ
jgi:uncharacterized protein YdaU (DUF1376 family)